MKSDLKNLLDQAQGWSDWLERRKQDSISALESVPPWGKWYFGLSERSLLPSDLSLFQEGVLVRRLLTSPSQSGLYSSSTNLRPDAIEAGLLVGKVSAELVLGFDGGIEEAKTRAYYACLAISVKTGQIFSCPIVSDSSFDGIESASPNSTNFWLTGDTPKLWRHDLPPLGPAATAEDVARCMQTMLDLHKVGTNRRLHVATQIYWKWAQSADPRIALMSIWGALDALFGKNERQAKKAIVSRLTDFCSTIEPDEVMEMYERRCDAVHGRGREDSYFIEGVVRSANLLRLSLDQISKVGRQPLPDQQP